MTASAPQRPDAPLPPPAPEGKRRRRSREVARAEILAAAEEFLSQHPFRDLSVEEVMARTGLSRSSFYVYFRDRHDLLLRLVERLGDEIYAVADAWYHGGEDPQRDLRDALAGVVEVYRRHGLVLRAIADASSLDPEAEAVYQGLVGRFVEASAARIREEIAAGRIDAIDPLETSTALVWMSERYLTRNFGVLPHRQDAGEVIGILHRIWLRSLY